MVNGEGGRQTTCLKSTAEVNDDQQSKLFTGRKHENE